MGAGPDTASRANPCPSSELLLLSPLSFCQHSATNNQPPELSSPVFIRSNACPPSGTPSKSSQGGEIPPSGLRTNPSLYQSLLKPTTSSTSASASHFNHYGRSSARWLDIYHLVHHQDKKKSNQSRRHHAIFTHPVRLIARYKTHFEQRGEYSG